MKTKTKQPTQRTAAEIAADFEAQAQKYQEAAKLLRGGKRKYTKSTTNSKGNK